MSAVPISSSLSASCSAALNANYANLNSACGVNGNVVVTNFLANAQRVLSTVCTAQCSAEIPKFTAATNVTCGTELIFQNDKTTTANYYSSYLQVISAAGCVKDTAGQFCLARQMGEVSRSGVNLNSPDAGARIISYSSKNLTFTCSACVGDEIKAVKELLAKGELEASLAGSVESVVKIPTLSCQNGFSDTAPTPKTNSAVASAGIALALWAVFIAI